MWWVCFVSRNVVGRISEVALHRAGLVLRLVTIHGYTIFAVAYLPLGQLGHAPPLNCEKNLAYGKKMQPKCAIFRQKFKRIFWGGGYAPPQTPPHWGGQYN